MVHSNLSELLSRKKHCIIVEYNLQRALTFCRTSSYQCPFMNNVTLPDSPCFFFFFAVVTRTSTIFKIEVWSECENEETRPTSMEARVILTRDYANLALRAL